MSPRSLTFAHMHVYQVGRPSDEVIKMCVACNRGTRLSVSPSPTSSKVASTPANQVDGDFIKEERPGRINPMAKLNTLRLSPSLTACVRHLKSISRILTNSLPDVRGNCFP